MLLPHPLCPLFYGAPHQSSAIFRWHFSWLPALLLAYPVDCPWLAPFASQRSHNLVPFCRSLFLCVLHFLFLIHTPLVTINRNNTQPSLNTFSPASPLLWSHNDWPPSRYNNYRVQSLYQPSTGCMHHRKWATISYIYQNSMGEQESPTGVSAT